MPKELQINKELTPIIKQRVGEFNKINQSNNSKWFHELVFCLLAANTSSKMASRVTDNISTKDFLNLSLEQLKIKLQEHSCRFFNKRAEYIIEARKHTQIKTILNKFQNSLEKRDWLIENIKGIGMKEASHFLRNTGHYDLAILDKHVKNVLFEHNYISEEVRSKALTKTKYLEIEETLASIANKLKLTQGELDFYIWHKKTGEVLK